MTAKDIPGRNHVGAIFKDQMVLAEDKVRFMGEAVAVAAAIDKQTAEKALKLIEVEYEPLPVVTSPIAAMAEDAPLVHEKGNILTHKKARWGDIEEGFRQACVVAEDTFKTQMVEHAYLEPEAGVAYVEGDNVVLYATSQSPYYHRSDVAAVLGWPISRVQMIQTMTGGAFGGKIDLSVHPYIALLAVKTGKPVKMVYTREESMLSSTKRHPFIMEYKYGADKNGKLVAAQIRVIADTGAYTSFGAAVLGKTCVSALGPYECPNVKVDTYAVFTNNPISGAMRGFGHPQTALAHETIMDMLAEKLGLSSVEIRRQNLLKNGSTTYTGQVLEAGVGMNETLEKAARYSGL